jgi:putative membrane protein
MKEPYPRASISVPEGTAKRWVWVFSVIVFLAVVVLDRVQVPTSGTWDVHVFARINAVINTVVSLLLLVGLFAAKAGRWGVHRTVMLGAILLSVLFLISYIMHHLFAGSTPYGGQGTMKVVYYVLLALHIVLAAGSLPFILLTAYRSLSARWPQHRKLARWVWPVWFFVSVSGVVVYLMISPYY